MPGKTFIDGWRGRIGLVATASGNATEAEFNLYRPKARGCPDDAYTLNQFDG